MVVVRPSVRPPVRPPARPSVRPPVRPFVLRGRSFSHSTCVIRRARERYFVLSDDELVWYKPLLYNTGAAPHGQLALAGARLERGTSKLVIESSHGDRLVLRPSTTLVPERLADWANAIESALKSVADAAATPVPNANPPNNDEPDKPVLLESGSSSNQHLGGSVRVPNVVSSAIRAMVSQEKKRFQQDGFEYSRQPNPASRPTRVRPTLQSAPA